MMFQCFGFQLSETGCLLFVKCLVVIVGVCNCQLAVAMMYISSRWYIFSLLLLCVRLFIIYWQCWLGLMTLDLCHVVFDSVVFIAPLYWGVNDVL